MSRPPVRGHEIQHRFFVNAVERGRLAHAYLFAGPEGIGKRIFAAELAKALLCENPSTDLTACGQCTSCHLVDADSHPDFFAVSRPQDTSELKIDVMRNLCQRFGLKPARGRGKVALLDDADDLNTEAANCFLKTLEEPPPHSFFFLIGTTPDRQLPTVVSRCQLVRFAPLADEIVAAVLRQNGVTDEALLARLVRLGRGSPGQALALADPDLWAFREVLVNGLAAPRVDSVALSKKLMEFVEDAGKETSAQRRRASQVLRLLVEFFDDVLAVRVGALPRLDDPQEVARLHKLAERVNPEVLLRILERCLEADAQTDRYIQLVLVLEALLDSLGVSLATK